MILSSAPGCAPAHISSHPAGPAESISANHALPDPRAQQIDSIATAFLAEKGLAGFSIAIVHGDEVVFDRGYGLADVENRVRASAATVYRIGSLTKPKTAAAILLLAERGLVNLTDSVGAFLPGYPPPGNAVTLAQLLSMTSGIPNYTTDPRLDYFREQLPHDSVVALFRNRPLLFPPGERYDYSNSNYYLLGLVIEKVSGRSYEEFVGEHVARPLGLNATVYCPNRPIIPHRAQGYRIADGALVNARPISVAWAYAAGGYCSTAADQVRWIRALSKGALIRPEWFGRMAEKTRLNSGVMSGYGFGLAVDELGGRTQLSHAGNLDGFQSSISYFPGDSLAVVVLTNTEDSGAAELKERVARHLLGIRTLTAADVADLALTAEERQRYLGTYALETVPVRFRVSETDGTLHFSTGDQAPIRLLYQGADRFVLATDPETSLEFAVEGGKATRVLVRSAAGNQFPGGRVQ